MDLIAERAHDGTMDASARTWLTDAVARDGIAAHELSALVVAREARALGAAPVATAVLTDRRAPRPARERALGRVLLALAALDAGAPSATERASG